jgi:hypothetical protein
MRAANQLLDEYESNDGKREPDAKCRSATLDAQGQCERLSVP